MGSYFPPRFVRIALGALLLGVSALLADRPAERARGPQPVEGIDQEEGRRLIENFRQQRLDGDYLFHFELRHLPRRGEESSYRGMMWGTWTPEGPRTRVSVWPAGQRETATRDYLLQGGAEPRVWTLDHGEPKLMSAEAQGQPFFEGMVYTPYDVMMPFAYWDLFEYTGSKRVRGRPAHLFVLYAPADVADRMPELAAVQLVLDADFNALIKAEMLDVNGEELRTLDVGGFKEIDEQYIVKEVDLIDERARDKTRFRVTGAAVGLDLPREIFLPQNLGQGPPDLGPIIIEPV